MTDAETLALELFPPKYNADTWKRRQPDVNAPLRAAYVRGFQESQQQQNTHNNEQD